MTRSRRRSRQHGAWPRTVLNSAVIVALVGPAACAQQASFTILPGTTSWVGGLSGDGTTVVGQDGSIAGRWVNSGSFEPFPGTVLGPAVSVSADGTTYLATTNIQVFRWSHNSVLQIPPPPPPAWLPVYNTSVSGDGVTLGLTPGVAPGVNRAANWTDARGWEFLPIPAGIVRSYTTAISHDGSVTVGGGYGADNHHAALYWRGVGAVRDLGLPPGFNGISAHNVSGDGRFVVGAVARAVAGTSSPYLWSAERGFVVLPRPTGWPVAWARAASFDGSVVVGAGYNQTGTYRTFVWTLRDGSRDLFDLMQQQYNLSTMGVIQGGNGGLVYTSYNGRVFAATGDGVGRVCAWRAELPEGFGCYANCDGSSSPPVLNAADFQCFLSQFAAGDTGANCDQSTTPPVLNVTDLVCFINRFAGGCS